MDGTVTVIHALKGYRFVYPILADFSGLGVGTRTEDALDPDDSELLEDEARRFADSEARNRGIIK